jgi:dynein heavy chain
MESEPHLFKKWYADDKPESCDLPKTIKDLGLFHRILLLRAVRPDRLSGALLDYVGQELGPDFVDAQPFDIVRTYDEMNPQTPTFFVLFPGVDPTPEVEKIGRLHGKTISDGTFINISMGQGQEENAIKALKEAGKVGNWVMFQNVHLMQTWMKSFERNFEIVVEDGAHPDFRCFVSSEPPGLPHQEIIPESILQNALKVANEAPQDLKSNIRRAFSKFDESNFKRAESHKLNEYKALLFGLCMFHSLILGRRKFGAQGWSRKYNFNDGDLTICGDILHNYLANYEQVPYADLQYLFGEVMYGGHITDDWDRRTNSTYLQVLIKPAILTGMNLTLAPGFRSPPQEKFNREAYVRYVDEKLPVEDPRMFGLHPNAETGYLTTQGENLFFTILQCSGGSGAGAGGKDAAIKEMINKFLDTMPTQFIMLDLFAKAKERSPYVVVCLQECERMNILTGTIVQTLEDLDAGLKGSLNITDDMEALGTSMFLNSIPDLWTKYAYFSLKGLGAWFDDLMLRINQLIEYADELIAPKSLWISGLFNPMSFLTSIK